MSVNHDGAAGGEGICPIFSSIFSNVPMHKVHLEPRTYTSHVTQPINVNLVVS